MRKGLIDFKYVPLSFISKQNEIERQSINTVIFQKVLDEFRELKPLGELLNSTQYGYTDQHSHKEIADSYELLTSIMGVSIGTMFHIVIAKEMRNMSYRQRIF